MKVIMYMASTINGIIAKKNDDTSFVSPVEWKHFNSMMRKERNLIVGRRTYEIMKNEGSLKNLDGVKIVVVTKYPKAGKNSIHFVRSPRAAVSLVKNLGIKSALVAGGGHLNSSFMKENLVDEIYLDVEPVALGRGINLFNHADFERKLRLVGTKKLSRNEIQLHYKVLKKR